MRRFAFLLALVLLATGCSDQATEVTAQRSQGAATPSETPAGATTPDILDFQAQTISGQTFQGGDYAGQDLMVWFWAPW